MSDEVVYVLGAGFTRAFVPKSPLLVDDYGVLELRKHFDFFPHAKSILDGALAEYDGRRVDLERLLTRLSGMPYDAAGARQEYALLETALKQSLVKRLREAKESGVNHQGLETFVKLIRKNNASIVTFNYDDILDEALWEDTKKEGQLPQSWHPDGGYGFYCKPSVLSISDSMIYMNDTRNLLLKLHGSINWRTRLGDGTPRGPSGILHHQEWYESRVRGGQTNYSRIESHLEPDSFIVPPVLVKAELAMHPVLSVVWTLARERLKTAKNVVFIGYSLPVTDLASRILFKETLGNRADCSVQVVSYESDEKAKHRIKDSYQSLFGSNLQDVNFDFEGASDWINRQT